MTARIASLAGKHLLITGGGGLVARLIRPHLRAAGIELRLLDRAPIVEMSDGESAVLADLSDMGALADAVRGMDGILHLAGCTADADWPAQIVDSVQGTINVFEAARAAGVSRVVYASSNHAVGMYPRAQRIAEDAMPRPDSRYGVAKAFGETIGALFADKYAFDVLCVRIGNVAERPVDRRRLSIWISPRDLAQLVRIGLATPDLGFRIVYGVSGNSRSFYRDDTARALGYAPEDSADRHAAEILAQDPPPDPPLTPGEIAQGGSFVDAEFVGDPVRLSRLA
jgi:uronate dehydrogenase